MSFARTTFRSVTTVAGPSRIARNLAAPRFQIRTATPLVSLTSRSEFGCISKRWNSSQSTNKPEDEESLRLEAPTPGSKPQTIGRIEPRLSMTMTCTANDCGHRSTHEFAKRSYEKGIVIIQCPSCKERHLIADNMGWFKESMEDGRLKTVEDLLRAKGEKIRKGRVGMDGDIEYEGEQYADQV